MPLIAKMQLSNTNIIHFTKYQIHIIDSYETTDKKYGLKNKPFFRFLCYSFGTFFARNLQKKKLKEFKNKIYGNR